MTERVGLEDANMSGSLEKELLFARLYGRARLIFSHLKNKVAQIRGLDGIPFSSETSTN